MKVTCPNCAHTFDPSKRATKPKVAPAPAKPRADAAGVVLLALGVLERDEPREVLHRVSELRARTTLSKEDFDRAALELERAGRITLHFHDYAPSLPAAERDAMVTDGRHFFHAVARRRGKASPAPAPAEVLETIRRLAKGERARRVKLADVRDALPDLPRDELDRELLALQARGAVVLYSEDNPAWLTARDKAAALELADDVRRHLVLLK